jgi:hypothetical protein
VGVSERLTVSFADAGSAIQLFAIAGVGALTNVGEQLTAAAPPVFAQTGESWRISSPGHFELELASWSHGAGLGNEGVLGWPCSASGSVGSRPVAGLAMVGRETGATASLERSLAVLFDPQLAFALRATRPPGAVGHGEEELAAVVFRGDPPEPARIEKPRLSSSYDSAGRLTHAGIELWATDDAEFPLRIGGEALASGELSDADGARTQVTFVAWHHEGRRGLGSYAIATPA